MYKGQVTVAEVAENLGYTYVSPEAALAQETEAA